MKLSNLKLFGLVAFIFLFFFRSLYYPFLHWDDYPNILQNPLLPLSWIHLQEIWRAPYYNMYIPVTYSSWSLLCTATSDCHAEVFHWFSVLLHMANTLLVLRIAQIFFKKINMTDLQFWAFISAGLFCFHPTQIETVAWISGSRDLLSAFWILLAWNLYWPEDKTSQENFPILRWIAVAILITLGILSKPSALPFPLALLIFDITIWKLRPQQLIHRSLPLMLLPLVFSGITIASQNLDSMRFHTPILLRPWIAVDAIGFYFSKIILPLNLTPDYGHSPELVVEQQIWFFSLLSILSLGLIFLWRKKIWPIFSLLLIWIALLSPYLGIVNFRFQDISTTSDHYLYLPWIIMSLILVLFLNLLKNKLGRSVAIGLSAVILCLCVLLSYQQLQKWSDTKTLGTWVEEINPRSFSFLNAMAEDAGDRHDYVTALKLYQESLILQPKLIQTKVALAVVKFLAGGKQEALEMLFKMDKENQLTSNDQIVLVKMLLNFGKKEEGIERLKKLRQEYSEDFDTRSSIEQIESQLKATNH